MDLAVVAGTTFCETNGEQGEITRSHGLASQRANGRNDAGIAVSCATIAFARTAPEQFYQDAPSRIARKDRSCVTPVQPRSSDLVGSRRLGARVRS